MGEGTAARQAKGFTLVEVLVACAISMVLLLILVGIVSQTTAVSKKANSALLAFNAASSALDLIAHDLESLAVTRQPFEFLQTVKEDVDEVTGVTRLLMLSVASQDNTDEADAGQVRAISYRLLHQDPVSAGGSEKVYGLYRSAATAKNTFETFSGQPDLTAPFGALAVSLDDFVVGNVVDFQVQFYAAGSQVPANGGSAIQPVRIGGNATTVNGTPYRNGPVTWAEVTLTVVEDGAVKPLESGAITLADAKQRFGHKLTRKVAIPSSF